MFNTYSFLLLNDPLKQPNKIQSDSEVAQNPVCFMKKKKNASNHILSMEKRALQALCQPQWKNNHHKSDDLFFPDDTNTCTTDPTKANMSKMRNILRPFSFKLSQAIFNMTWCSPPLLEKAIIPSPLSLVTTHCICFSQHPHGAIVQKTVICLH
ncbi:hypothetical protein EGR_10934 [Echinococcus granulosus]|uniref:Uncharacterized protein n=1 Tax=Echinococcus granulosus TaxID=6210 RepID=W6U154_ECHGR|nr:hypothetical protein EGR_10934 [Echinococcus granulosus]EUB54206.1 hypothetical protein EGR_10934 [Echinococcus granulosus]